MTALYGLKSKTSGMEVFPLLILLMFLAPLGSVELFVVLDGRKAGKQII